MKRFDIRTIVGAGFVVLGGLLFLEKLGLLHGAGDLFWGLLLLAGAAYFGYVYFTDRSTYFWAIFPALVLLGMSAGAFLPPGLDNWSGAFFLGAIGLAFWIIYLNDRVHWWAIIPGGVLFTLAGVSVIRHASSTDTGSLFFLGLAVTFLLVAVLPNPLGKMQWAYIPAGALALIGFLVGGASTVGLSAYVWPAVLILVGIFFIFGFFVRRE